MARFLIRHWTAIIVTAAIAGWAFLYVPYSPSFAVLQLKLAIDERDGDAASRFIDFDEVVKNAAMELAREKAGEGDLIGRLLSQGAAALFSRPAADALEAWAKREVETGAQEVQMPAVAVAGSLVLLHRSGDTAFTRFRDHKGQVWEIRMARNADGQWQVVAVSDVRVLLEKLQREQAKQLNAR